jgi:hypothetical protein
MPPAIELENETGFAEEDTRRSRKRDLGYATDDREAGEETGQDHV